MLKQLGTWSKARFGAMAMTIALMSSLASFAPVAHAGSTGGGTHKDMLPDSVPCQLFQPRVLESENFNDGPSGSYKMTVTLYEQYDVNFGMWCDKMRTTATITTPSGNVGGTLYASVGPCNGGWPVTTGIGVPSGAHTVSITTPWFGTDYGQGLGEYDPSGASDYINQLSSCAGN